MKIKQEDCTFLTGIRDITLHMYHYNVRH